MIETILTAAISFVSTNIDNLFIIVLLCAKLQNYKAVKIVFGQYVGIGILVGLSLGGTWLVSFIPSQYIGVLGLVPIALGIKSIIDYKKEKRKRKVAVAQAQAMSDAESDEITEITPKRKRHNFEILGVIGITIANGADNIGVYIPLFSRYDSNQLMIAVLIFAIFLLVWCFAGIKLAGLPFIKNKLEKYKHIIVPIVFIALGIYIIIKAQVLL